MEEVSVSDFIRRTTLFVRFLLSKWLFIGAMGIGLGLIGVLYAWMTKPVYIARINFVTDVDNSSRMSAYAGLAAQFGFDLGGGNNSIFEGENLMELLRSQNLVQKTLLSPYDSSGTSLMIDVYANNHKLSKEWNVADGIPVHFKRDVSNNSRAEDSILQKIGDDIVKKQLVVEKKDKKLNFIQITMEDIEETFSKRFVELLTSNAIQFYTEYKSKKSRQNVDILQRQSDSVKAMLFGGISDVASVSDLNVNPMRQSLRTGVQRRQVDVQTNAALYTELIKNLELSKLSLRKETPLIQIIDKPLYPLEKKGIGRAKTGIIFGLIGGVLAIIILLIRQRVKWN